MIRTLIEVSADDDWQHSRQLKETLDKLGYEPKPSEDHVRFMGDLYRELQDRGLVPHELVEAQRKKRETQ